MEIYGFRQILLVLITSTITGSCDYRASFFGRSSFQPALDATNGRGAQLADLPNNPTNTSVIDSVVFGIGVTKYVYSFVDGDVECSGADYSGIRQVSTRITADLDSEGRKKLCVKGAGNETGLQNKATEYSWTIDKTPPMPFSLTDTLQSVSKNYLSQISWTESAGADSYDIEISSSFNCKSNLVQSLTLNALSTRITELKDGTYYICATAKDLAGNATPAANSPFKIQIDSTPPGRFHIYAPISLINDTSPKVKWTEASDVAHYAITIANDVACTSVIEERKFIFTNEYKLVSVLQNDHIYYVCARALDGLDNGITADNSGYPFSVDTTGVLISFEPSTLPAPNSNGTTSAIRVTSSSDDFTYFRYAIGPISLNCALASNYGDAIPAGTFIPPSTLSTPDGLHKVCAIGGDRAGNWMNPASTGTIGYISYHWLKDTVGPSLAFTIPDVCGPNVCGGSPTPNIPVTNYVVSDGGSGIAKVEVLISPLSATVYPVAASGIEIPKSLFNHRSGTYTVTVTATDRSGNKLDVAKRFVWDQVAPVLSSFVIVGKPEISKPFTYADLVVNEAHSTIKDICFRSSIIVAGVAPATSTPSESDACWVRNTASHLGAIATPSRVPYVIGFIPEVYKGQAWVRDAANNASALKEDAKIRFNPGAVPELTSVLATSNNAQSVPLSVADRTINLTGPGSKLFVKWIARDSDKDLPANPISIYYTLNEVDWVPIVENISAGQSSTTCQPQSIVGPQNPAREQSGCFEWGNLPAGLSGYAKIRVAIKDSDDQVTFATAPILNLPQVNFLAGNTENGIGASARSTIFQNQFPSAGEQDTGSVLVTKRGEIIFRDYRRGIFRVTADTGVLQLLIKNDSTAPRNDEELPLDEASLKSPIAIALDYEDRVLVLEYDRLRLIDLAKGTIKSIAGQGTPGNPGNNDGETGVTANNIKITVNGERGSKVLFAMPNNKIAFVSNTSSSGATAIQPVPRQRIRVLDLNSPTMDIRTLQFSGTFDFTGDLGKEVSDCRVLNMALGFDRNTANLNAGVIAMIGLQIPSGNAPKYWEKCGVTNARYKTRFMAVEPLTMKVDKSSDLNVEAYLWGSSIVGLDGQIYHVDRSFGEILKYNPTLRKFSKIVGYSFQDGASVVRVPGTCPDFTDALSCAIDPQDVFVSADSRIFFMDRGRLRTIQGSGAGAKVVTIMGQSYGYGDGATALSARFGIVKSFARWSDGANNKKIVILDALEQKFREATVGGNVSLVAGDGISRDPKVGSSAPIATQQSIAIDVAGRNIDSFVMRPTGAIIFRTTTQLVELNRQTQRWVPFAGTPGKPLWRDAANGSEGLNVSFNVSGAYPQLLGIDTTSSTTKFLFQNTYLDPRLDPSITAQDSFLMTFSLNADNSSAILNRIAGKKGVSAQIYTDFDPGCLNNLALDCALVSGFSTDYLGATPVTTSTGTAWIFAHMGTETLMKIDTDGKLLPYQVLLRRPHAFAIKKAARDAEDVVFYCGNDGNLWRRENSSEVKLSLGPISGANRLICSGRQMHYDSVTNRLTFIYSQNGLNGIAEYSP